jgi:SM-20-related protein
MRGSVISLDYNRLGATPVSVDPFPHVIVPGFVPRDELGRVLAGMPVIEKRGSFPPASLKLGAAARALVDALEGPAFRAATAEKFGLDLGDAPTMLTMRGWTDERDGRIHTDSTAKRVTVLLYLNPDEGDYADHSGHLRLLRSPTDLEDYAAEVAPTDGTLLIFPNGPSTWHGHHRFVGRRYSIQLNYMTTDAVARSELRRHRISAFVKRLTQAA